MRLKIPVLSYWRCIIHIKLLNRRCRMSFSWTTKYKVVLIILVFRTKIIAAVQEHCQGVDRVKGHFSLYPSHLIGLWRSACRLTPRDDRPCTPCSPRCPPQSCWRPRTGRRNKWRLRLYSVCAEAPYCPVINTSHCDSNYMSSVIKRKLLHLL